MKVKKDSNVEFIGLIPSDWTVLRFKNLGFQRNGLTYKPENMVGPEEGTLVLRSSNIKNGKMVYDDNVYVSIPIPEILKTKIGDILICSRNGSKELIGKNALIDKQSEGQTFGAFMMLFRTKENSKYLYYILNSPVFSYYLGTFFTSTINQLTGQNFENMKIPYTPSLAEQKAISDFLDKKCGEIDEISEIIESQIDALEKYKKSIITEATSKGLDPNVEMTDSGIQWVGAIPKHWNVLKGKYCFENDKEVVGARVDDFERLALTLNGVIKRSKEDNTGLQPEKFNTYQILRNDELVFKLIDLQNVSTSRVGLSPYVGIVSGAYIILKAKENMNPHYAEKYYLSMWMNQIFNYLGDAGVRSSLNANDLLEIRIPVPPLAEQKAISDFLDKKCGEIDEIIEAKRQQLKKIDEYKKSIIYEYVTGKKEVAYE